MSTPTGQPGDDEGKTPVAPLTGWGKFVVVLGFLCLLTGAGVLIWGDKGPVAQCSTEKTEQLVPSPGSDGAPGPSAASATPTAAAPPSSTGLPTPPSQTPKPKLTVVTKVTTCSPSDLKGGLALLLAVLGIVFVLPGLLRILPAGVYKAPGGIEANTAAGAEQQTAARTARENAEVLREISRAFTQSQSGQAASEPDLPAPAQPPAAAPATEGRIAKFLRALRRN